MVEDSMNPKGSTSITTVKRSAATSIFDPRNGVVMLKLLFILPLRYITNLVHGQSSIKEMTVLN